MVGGVCGSLGTVGPRGIAGGLPRIVGRWGESLAKEVGIAFLVAQRKWLVGSGDRWARENPWAPGNFLGGGRERLDPGKPLYT
jgi:hypothetical protein